MESGVKLRIKIKSRKSSVGGSYVKESMRLERKPAVLITADFSGPNVEAYAMAWLKLTNNAREYPKMIYKIWNERNSDKVYVLCDPKKKI